MQYLNAFVLLLLVYGQILRVNLGEFACKIQRGYRRWRIVVSYRRRVAERKKLLGQVVGFALFR